MKCKQCGHRLDDDSFCECCGNQASLRDEFINTIKKGRQLGKSGDYFGEQADTSLSDKIWFDTIHGENAIQTKDVKEFIKKLKEETQRGKNYETIFSSIWFKTEVIDKLAGKKLI